MTSKTIYASLAFVIAITFACTTARGEDGEFYVNTYRSLGTVSPQGVRSAAMGRAGRGLADGVYSLGVNPAALGAHQGAAIDVALGFDWLDDGYDNADQVTFKLGGAVSLDRWSRLAGPNQAVGALLHTQNYSGASNNSMKRNQTGVLMAYGLHFMENLLGGVSVALYDGDWKSEIARDEAGEPVGMNMDRSFTGGDFKVGGLYRVTDQTTFGGTIGYSTGSFKEKAAYAGSAGSGSLERWSIGVGVAHQYTDDTLILGDIWYDRLKTDVPGILDESNKA